MTATTLLRAMLRNEVGLALRAVGFTGSARTWTLRAPNSDVAIVNVQSAQASSADDVKFIVNLALAPQPWRAWRNTLLNRLESCATKESDGLWRDRLHASSAVPHDDRGGETWWVIRDERDARACADDVTSQLVQRAVPRLRRLLDRDALLATIRTGDFGFLHGDPTVAVAVLLSDQGPGSELDDLVTRIATDPDDRRRGHNAQLLDWIRLRIGPDDRPAARPT